MGYIEGENRNQIILFPESIEIIGTPIYIEITSFKPYNESMPRIARIVAAGYPHHITQRGNYQQKTFSDDTDRNKYLSLLKEENKRYHLIIWSRSPRPGRDGLMSRMIPRR